MENKTSKQHILILHLEERSSFALLITTNLKMLAPLQNRNTTKITSIRYKNNHIHLQNKISETVVSFFQLNKQTNLDCMLRNMLATLALQPQNNFLGGFCLYNKIKHKQKLNQISIKLKKIKFTLN